MRRLRYVLYFALMACLTINAKCNTTEECKRCEDPTNAATPLCQALFNAGVCKPAPTPTPPPIDCRVTLCPPGQCCKEGVGCTVCPTPEPTPTPTPTPTPVPTPTPTPPPAPVACHPHPDDPGWGQPIPVSQRPTLLYREYAAAIAAVGNTCGQASADEVLQRQTLDRVAAKWRELFPNRCVTSPGDWGGSGDSVSAKAPDGIYEEWHAVYFGNGCIIDGPNAYKNGWPCPGCVGAEPYPTPPPPTAGCSYPVPSKVSRINIKKHNNWYDTTPQICDKAYCTAIEMADRTCCPARSECPGFKCEERVACEAVALGGQCPKFHCEIGEPNVNGDNCFQARCAEGSWIEVCAADGVTACNRIAIAR